MNATPLSFPRTLLPDAPGLVLEDAHFVDEEMIAILHSTAPAASCPLCGASSSSIHSHYRRAPTDLPWGGHPVKLILCVRRFFCKGPSCMRRIFTERLSGVVAPWARTTERLTMLLRAVAFALGGEAGARLAKRIGLATSPATLISMIRRTPLPDPTPARVLGVDDWAHRKGTSYGTALVDLEKHRLIELLPDRESETFARWLKANPGAEVISRDRSEKYAAAGRRGAPEATHVADRWHLLHNWREAIERVFDRHRGRIKQVVVPTRLRLPASKPASSVLPAKSVNRRRKYLEEQQARAQAKRLARYKEIRKRHARGEYLTTIARDLEIDYKTARKYALSDECPTRKPHPPRKRMLGPYEPYLRARWKEGCKNGKGLYREICAHGYPGSRTQVADFIARLRREENGKKPQDPSPSTATGEPLTPHKAAMLLLRRPERCDEAEHAARAGLRSTHPDVEIAVGFTERFVEIIRERRGAELGRWLSDAEASGTHEIQQFAHKVRLDEGAVRAGCTLPWSNGQTEGQITRLKTIKRSMYGRARFDLLRQRALYAS